MRIYEGGVHPPLGTFLISDFVLQDTKKIFYQCYQYYLRHLTELKINLKVHRITLGVSGAVQKLRNVDFGHFCPPSPPM